jgi:hypothetical protein
VKKAPVSLKITDKVTLAMEAVGDKISPEIVRVGRM